MSWPLRSKDGRGGTQGTPLQPPLLARDRDDAIASVIELHAEPWVQENGRRVYEGWAAGRLWRVVRDTDLAATVVTVSPAEGRTPTP